MKLDIPNQGLIPKSILIVIFSFKVISPLGEANAAIFSNKDGNRAVSINNKQLDVWGTTASPQIEHLSGSHPTINKPTTQRVSIVAMKTQFENEEGRQDQVIFSHKGASEL